MAEIDDLIRAKTDVVSVAGFIGRGASRYMLTYNPEQPNSSYGQFIVRATDIDLIDPLAAEPKQELSYAFPNAEIRTERLVFGPSAAAKIEARFSGSDPAILRQLGSQATAIMAANKVLIDVRTNWRQKEPVLTPAFNVERARIDGIALNEVALAENQGNGALAK